MFCPIFFPVDCCLMSSEAARADGEGGGSAGEGDVSTHEGTGVLVQHVVPPAEGSGECLCQKVWCREVREALAQVHFGVGSSQFYKLHPGEKGNKSTFRGSEQCAGTRSACSIPLEGSGVDVPPAELTGRQEQAQVISDLLQLNQA